MSNREKLIECSKAIKTALMSNDTGALKKLYSEDFRGFSINGDEETLEVIIEAYQPEAVKLEVLEAADPKVEVFGEVGIISGTGYVKGRFGEYKFEHHLCFTDIYLNQNGMWRCYRSHATELPSE